MKTWLSHGFAVLLTWLASTARVLAHPGHDDHDLTWDLTHLAAHPIATGGWAALLLVGGGVAWHLQRRAGRPRLPDTRS